MACTVIARYRSCVYKFTFTYEQNSVNKLNFCTVYILPYDLYYALWGGGGGIFFSGLFKGAGLIGQGWGLI